MSALALGAIRLDGGTQPRAATDFAIVEEYAHSLAEGAVFPSVVTFFDGTDYWLADGFHRWHAHQAAALAEIEADVRQGSQRDAILYSVGVNASHGVRRTNADKRRAVMRLLDDAEWSQWSDREIARRCAVANGFVHKLKKEREPDTVHGEQYETRTFTHPKTGQPAQMRTQNIGSNPAPRPAPVAAPAAPIKPPSDVDRIEAVGAPRERAEQLAQDNANGFISSALWEIERQMKVLPADAADAARRFPSCHRHTLTSIDLRRFADWFATFADEFIETEREFHVAAE